MMRCDHCGRVFDDALWADEDAPYICPTCWNLERADGGAWVIGFLAFALLAALAAIVGVLIL